MGCDIHPVLQVRQTEFEDTSDLAWRSVATPDDRRCYPFFYFLTGCIRWDGDVPNLGPPKGLPKDFASWDYEEYLSDEHTPHWITLEEARTADAGWLKTAYPGGDWPWQQWQMWLKTMEFYRELYGVRADQVRVVMDFDS